MRKGKAVLSNKQRDQFLIWYRISVIKKQSRTFANLELMKIISLKYVNCLAKNVES